MRINLSTNKQTNACPGIWYGMEKWWTPGTIRKESQPLLGVQINTPETPCTLVLWQQAPQLGYKISQGVHAGGWVTSYLHTGLKAPASLELAGAHQEVDNPIRRRNYLMFLLSMVPAFFESGTHTTAQVEFSVMLLPQWPYPSTEFCLPSRTIHSLIGAWGVGGAFWLNCLSGNCVTGLWSTGFKWLLGIFVDSDCETISINFRRF